MCVEREYDDSHPRERCVLVPFFFIFFFYFHSRLQERVDMIRKYHEVNAARAGKQGIKPMPYHGNVYALLDPTYMESDVSRKKNH